MTSSNISMTRTMNEGRCPHPAAHRGFFASDCFGEMRGQGSRGRGQRISRSALLGSAGLESFRGVGWMATDCGWATADSHGYAQSPELIRNH